MKTLARSPLSSQNMCGLLQRLFAKLLAEERRENGEEGTAMTERAGLTAGGMLTVVNQVGRPICGLPPHQHRLDYCEGEGD